MSNPLTKREAVAAMALQGLLTRASRKMLKKDPHFVWEVLAEDAVNAADALLEQLASVPAAPAITRAQFDDATREAARLVPEDMWGSGRFCDALAKELGLGDAE